MSAFISCQTATSVVILTDGAVYDRDNILLRIERKIKVSDRAPVAIATRGHSKRGAMAAARIIGWVEEWGFDEAMRVLGKVVDQFEPASPEDAIEVLIAGISETSGPRHMTFLTVPNYGEAALVLKHPGQTCAAVPSTGGLSEMGVRRPRAGETAEEYFAGNGRAIMQFYREQPIKPGIINPVVIGKNFVVGGQLDMTVVTPDGVTVRTVHRWGNDKIGEKIDPFAQTNVVQIRGMSRQQRRAAERADRKRA